MTTNTDVDIAIKALSHKSRRYDQLWQYYDGQQPLIYNNEKLREIFKGLNARFTVNWCAVVVDSILDRLSILSATMPGEKATTEGLADLWAESGLSEDVDAIHEEIAVVGESFVIAWKGEAVEAYHNDARLVHAEYAPDNPREMRFAAKWHKGDDGRYILTMYYPDRLEYYRQTNPQTADGGAVVAITSKSFEPMPDMPTADNPFGAIPVFHFRSNQRKPMSQIANVLEPQDAINKLMADMMVAAEFGAYKQRWIISSVGVNGSKVKNSPNEIWDLPAGMEGEQPTQTGQFEATDLGNYLSAIDKLAMSIGVITRTPKHYFYGQGGDPSGEALIALEAPLNKKCQRMINVLTPTWQRLAAFLLALNGSGDSIAPRSIFINYDKPQTVQPRTQAEIRKINREAGLPLTTILRDEGWDDDDLAELDADLQAESAATANYADAALSAAQRNFDQGAA